MVERIAARWDSGSIPSRPRESSPSPPLVGDRAAPNRFQTRVGRFCGSPLPSDPTPCPLGRVADDLVVVGSEHLRIGEGLVDADPQSVCRVVSANRAPWIIDHSPVRHRHDPHPGVAIRGPVGGELFEMWHAQPRLLFELPVCGAREIFFDVYEAAGESPTALPRVLTPDDEEDAQVAVFDVEQSDVDGHRERGIVARVVAGWCGHDVTIRIEPTDPGHPPA